MYSSQEVGYLFKTSTWRPVLAVERCEIIDPPGFQLLQRDINLGGGVGRRLAAATVSWEAYCVLLRVFFT